MLVNIKHARVLEKKYLNLNRSIGTLLFVDVATPPEGGGSNFARRAANYAGNQEFNILKIKFVLNHNNLAKRRTLCNNGINML